jgi:hypothetical protein
VFTKSLRKKTVRSLKYCYDKNRVKKKDISLGRVKVGNTNQSVGANKLKFAPAFGFYFN